MTETPKKADFAPLLALNLPQRIMQITAKAGGEARFVGGVVRDALLGKDMAHATDIDMATTLTPDESMPLLAASGLTVIATGIDHGTITVLDPTKNSTDSPRLVVELTTLRQDIETHGRRATVRFGSDWLEDARRRDFTINAMSLTADGTLYDPFDGVADLRAGTVRFVGDASRRISEDYLRILRFFRFYAGFAQKNIEGGMPDSEALTAITALADNLTMISGERIAGEMEKILLARSPETLAAMVATGVDRQIAQHGFNSGGFKIDGVGQLFELAVSPYFCLGFIIEAGDVAAVVERLRLSKRASRHLALATQPLDYTALERKNWQAYAWQLTKDRSVMELAYGYATAKLRAGGVVKRQVFERLRDWSPPTLPIRGEDLRQKGIPTGKKIGRLLDYGERHWLQSNLTADRAELLAAVDRVLGGDDGR